MNKYADVAGSELENSLREGVSDVIKCFAGIRLGWAEVRAKHDTGMLIQILGVELLDVLDAVGDIYTCSNEECKRLCHDDWDFCLQCGSKG